MPEPLKNKAFELDPRADAEEGSAFWYKDVKLAVQGLLEELEKLDRIELEEFAGEQFDNLHDPEEIIAHCIDYFKYLIKKWLEGGEE